MILGSVMGVGAQKYHYLLDDFRAFKDKEKVVLTWVMGAGSTCVGIGIYRATDDLDFELIGEIKQICGSATEPTNFSFVDKSPVLGKTNYYRLQMGFSGRTDRSVSVEFKELGRRGYQAFPNPYSGVTRVYFDNAAYDMHFLMLYNSIGQQVVELQTTGEYFSIDLSISENSSKPEIIFSGVQYFVIRNATGQKVISGTLVRTNSD